MVRQSNSGQGQKGQVEKSGDTFCATSGQLSYVDKLWDYKPQGSLCHVDSQRLNTGSGTAMPLLQGS